MVKQTALHAKASGSIADKLVQLTKNRINLNEKRNRNVRSLGRQSIPRHCPHTEELYKSFSTLGTMSRHSVSSSGLF